MNKIKVLRTAGSYSSPIIRIIVVVQIGIQSIFIVATAWRGRREAAKVCIDWYEYQDKEYKATQWRSRGDIKTCTTNTNKYLLVITFRYYSLYSSYKPGYLLLPLTPVDNDWYRLISYLSSMLFDWKRLETIDLTHLIKCDKVKQHQVVRATTQRR